MIIAASVVAGIVTAGLLFRSFFDDLEDLLGCLIYFAIDERRAPMEALARTIKVAAWAPFAW